MIVQHENATEILRQEIQSSLDAEKSLAERNRLGQYATPYSLAIEITELVQSLYPNLPHYLHFGDPAIGSGSFFSAALATFGRNRITSAIGIEIDASFAAAAQKLWANFGLEVHHADFTRLIASDFNIAAPNLLLTNPPYIRHHHLDRATKERLQRLTRRLTGVEVNGLAGLYIYFLLLATSWMAEEGIAAWLIPSEFMDVNYGESVKRFLLDHVTLRRVHRFDPDDVQFGDALVSSAVIVFRKTRPPVNHLVEFSFGGTIRSPAARELTSIERLRKTRKWTVLPSHAKNDRRPHENEDQPTLMNLFRIQRGIATGCNKFFVLDRADAERRGLPANFLRPILPSPRFLKDVIIEADQDGYPLLNPQLCVIDCDLPETLVRSEHPALWHYLQTAETLGIREGYLIKKRNPWYRQEQREPAPFLCTYMGRGANDKQPFRFIWNRSQAVASNLYLLLYPRGAMREMLKRYPDRGGEIREILSCISGYELRGAGRVYGGGLQKIEPKELGRISAVSLISRWPELQQTDAHFGSRHLFS
jgi:predicted RNA methylase